MSTTRPQRPCRLRWGSGRVPGYWWLISLLLMAPATVPYLAHYGVFGGDYLPGSEVALQPTGFIQLDMPYYMANAREHFDDGGFRPLYGSPFSVRYETPTIYFQPVTFALGLAWRATGLDPGVIFVAFGLVAALCCARIAVALYREVAGLDSWPQWLGLAVFFWGGGLLILVGIPHFLTTKAEGSSFSQLISITSGAFAFDPGNGWWFLNFGRNLIFPTEAFYHAAFFGCILLTLRRRYAGAAAAALVVSASHPFTGVELLLILCAWSTMEAFFLKNPDVPRSFSYTCLALLGLHFAYYMGFLRLSYEHRQLMEQWAIPGATIEAASFIPAYALVGGLAFWACRRFELARAVFARPGNRLFLFWFLVAFTLANHEFAIRPVQPVHFTRGYEWTALFLLGVGPLVALFTALLARERRPWGGVVLAAVLLVFLSDNMFWIGTFPARTLDGQLNNSVKLISPQVELLDWMDSPQNRGVLLLSQDSTVGYLATTYTPLRSWSSHPFNTPKAAVRSKELDALFHQGRVLDYWKERPLLIVCARGMFGPNGPPWQSDLKAVEVYQNPAYQVFRTEPGRIENAVAHAGGANPRR